MKQQKLIFIILFLLTIAGYAQDVPSQYKKQLLQERKVKDKEFLNPEESPLTSDGMASFVGLSYFKPDKKYVIYAKLVRKTSPDTIKMKTTTERLPLYIVYGDATFNINGKQHQLTIYRNVGLMTKEGYEDYLFVPFTDQTSGNESYGGGRYIDARIPANDTIVLDFNKAYNPYCCYSKKYSCPIPPSQNYIDAKIKAGEKNFKH
ncbi:MAG: DUF1684 domain-containing protein [Omnitrophica WOR_2 bacterium]